MHMKRPAAARGRGWLAYTGGVKYTDPATGKLTCRPLRMWEVGGEAWAVVTEMPGVPGPSVTEAARAIRGILAGFACKPGQVLRVFEHYPAIATGGEERFAEQVVGREGMECQHIPKSELVALLAELDDTDPVAAGWEPTWIPPRQ